MSHFEGPFDRYSLNNILDMETRIKELEAEVERLKDEKLEAFKMANEALDQRDQANQRIEKLRASLEQIESDPDLENPISMMALAEDDKAAE